MSKAKIVKPGKVKKIIKAPYRGVPEKAEISVEGADELYKEIRIENRLEDANGNDVKLKQGAEVEVAVEANPDAIIPDKAKPANAVAGSDD